MNNEIQVTMKIISKLNEMNKKDKETMIQNLEKEMREAARTLDFERAAQLRDMIIEMREG